jgi:anti-anti-sigma factor
MKMSVETQDTGVAVIHLEGDLDAKGTGQIELQFAAVTGEQNKVLLDMAKVGFLASIGIRALLSASKVMGRRGGKLVVFRPSPAVEQVLKTCGADAILGLTHDLAEAETVLGGMA